VSTSVSQQFKLLADKAEAHLQAQTARSPLRIQIGSATCEQAAGADVVFDEFRKHVQASGRGDILLHRTGCTGRCSREPIVSVFVPGQTPVKYERVDRNMVHDIFTGHVQGGSPVTQYVLDGSLANSSTNGSHVRENEPWRETYGDVAFFGQQDRVALRHNGVIDPESMEEYFHYLGFLALVKVLESGNPDWVVDEVTRSKLRGRGGGGFSTGQKWAMARKADEKTRYIICNADEGDPGAFMDRSMLESDPLNVIEGMMIGGYAIGAQKGFFYIRAEYPMAIRRIQHAIDLCRQWCLLGENILGSGFDFDLEIRLGAGAFVCGEETALIHSIEGERGQPRIRPPYPTECGLFGKPTVINNVETFANIPAVIVYGADWFAGIGTPQSGGTKVFALSGKTRHTGLVEVPMGTTLGEVVNDIGGGVAEGKQLKAIQTGGPAGGCIPAKWIDLPIDFDTLSKAGSIMGSGGMIVLDEDDCMVDIAKFYVTFSQDESCGKCTPCREGSVRMLEILEKITSGKAELEDLDKLKRLALLMKKTSLCGLGRAAPNPVLSTLEHFHDEYLAHVVEKKCPAHRCTQLIHYEIDEKKCIGCTLCGRNCPAECISGARKQPHKIDQSRCIKCGRCNEVCRFDAVLKL
jgi:NADH:ubiquinone oxidoreductase subunit F (NADH-binding)/(2Fe-2S) ferredoxin